MTETPSADELGGAGGLQSDFLKLVENSGLADLAKELGFVDKNNQIEKLKVYEGMASLPLQSLPAALFVVVNAFSLLHDRPTP